jgi:hypothetical protein
VERAILGATHLLELAGGATAETSPAVGVEVRVVRGGVRVVHWLRGEPLWVVRVSGSA